MEQGKDEPREDYLERVLILRKAKLATLSLALTDKIQWLVESYHISEIEDELTKLRKYHNRIFSQTKDGLFKIF